MIDCDLFQARGRYVRHLLSRYRRTLHLYDRKSDWILSIYSDFLRLSKLAWLPGRGRSTQVSATNLQGSIRLRIGSTDWITFEEVVLHGEYAIVKETLEKSVKVVLDLGANVGITCKVWRTWYPEAQVIGVEPERQNASLARVNSDKQVAIMEFGVGPENDQAFIRRKGGDDSFVLDTLRESPDVSADPVQVLTIDAILQACGIDGTVDLLKCDIEGSEERLFGSCISWISRFRYIVIEVHFPYTPALLVADIAEGKGHFSIVSQTEHGNRWVLLLKNCAYVD